MAKKKKAAKPSMAAMAREALKTLKGEATASTMSKWVQKEYGVTLKDPDVQFSQAKVVLARRSGRSTADGVMEFMREKYGMGMLQKQAQRVADYNKRKPPKSTDRDVDDDAAGVQLDYEPGKGKAILMDDAGVAADFVKDMGNDPVRALEVLKATTVIMGDDPKKAIQTLELAIQYIEIMGNDPIRALGILKSAISFFYSRHG